eukprot:232398-Pelagomonas_calceolata.AAC.2
MDPLSAHSRKGNCGACMLFDAGQHTWRAGGVPGCGWLPVFLLTRILLRNNMHTHLKKDHERPLFALDDGARVARQAVAGGRRQSQQGLSFARGCCKLAQACVLTCVGTNTRTGRKASVSCQNDSRVFDAAR